MRQAIRDAVNRGSRKPFYWGGLKGYEQLESIAQALQDLPDSPTRTDYLGALRKRIEFVLTKNQSVAEDLKQAHHFLLAVANCLHYPPESSGLETGHTPGRQQVTKEMTRLIEKTRPIGRLQRAQIRLLGALKRRWELYGQELLYCFDIPGLPQDNLKLESLFGRLRRHQRRISGRKSTRELQAFGQAQVLLIAPTFQDLLRQIQQVPRERYGIQRQRLAEAEQSRLFFHRLHHNPGRTITGVIDAYTFRCQQLNHPNESIPLNSSCVIPNRQ